MSPYPGRGIEPLGGALVGFRSDTLAEQLEPGTGGRVGVKSAEGYTPAMVDVQSCTVEGKSL